MNKNTAPLNETGMSPVSAKPTKGITPQFGHDLRDGGAPVKPIHAHRLTPPARPGRGLHDKSLMGG